MPSMKAIDHSNLRAWANRLSPSVIFGFICTLLILGKTFNYVFQRRGHAMFGFLIIPPALLSGLFGLFFLFFLDWFDSEVSNDLVLELDGFKINLQNFVFASLSKS